MHTSASQREQKEEVINKRVWLARMARRAGQVTVASSRQPVVTRNQMEVDVTLQQHRDFLTRVTSSSSEKTQRPQCFQDGDAGFVYRAAGCVYLSPSTHTYTQKKDSFHLPP